MRNPFILFCLLFGLGAVLEIGAILLCLSTRVRTAAPGALLLMAGLGAVLVGAAALLDRDFTLLVGQTILLGLLGWLGWPNRRNPTAPDQPVRETPRTLSS